MNKKGISGVVTAVVMIALVMAASSMVWVMVNNIVQEKLDEAGSCFDTFEKATINPRYTCYNTTSHELQFSINIGDIELTELLVSVSDSEGQSKSFKLNNEGSTSSYLRYYPTGTFGETIFVPAKNSGKAYLFDINVAGITNPNSIQIAPVVGGKQCEVSDSLQNIDNCKSLVY